MSRPGTREAKTPQEQYEQLQKRLALLQGERKAIFEHSSFTIRQNKQTINHLQKEHKELRAQLRQISKKTTHQGSKPKPDELNEGIKYRRKLDQLRSIVSQKKSQLRTMQDKLKDMNADHKGVLMNQDAPLMRQIRILENRLDKAMIKYNQAQSIRKTYQQIVKQLKQQRVAYDNQLAAIQKSLKGKQHDFQELLLLSHDANHAKQTSEAQLCRFEAQITVERMTREKNVQEKKLEVQQRVEATQQLEIAQRNRGEQGDSPNKLINRFSAGLASQANQQQRLKQDKRKIKSYQDAFRRIKESTGVSDVNEVIQKFTTQQDTATNLENLKREHQQKIQILHAQQADLKRQVQEFKYSTIGEVESRKYIDDLQTDTQQSIAKYQKSKQKFLRLNDILVNLKAGIEHIAEKLEGIKLEGQANLPVTENNLSESLEQNKWKLLKLYQEVKGTDLFNLVENQGTIVSKPADTAQRTAAVLKAISSVPELSATAQQMEKSNAYNCRVKIQGKEEEEPSDEDAEEVEAELNLREKRDPQLTFETLNKGLKVQRVKSASVKKRKGNQQGYMS